MTTTTNSVLQSLGVRSQQQLQQAQQQAPQTLGQSDFLNLMIAQLKNQDPTKPLNSNQMISQMAQFSQVTGLQQLQKSFATLSSSLSSNQALQASNLVGHKVLAPTGAGILSSGGDITGAVDLPSAASNVTVQIHDQSGQLVRTLDLGPQAAGPAIPGLPPMGRAFPSTTSPAVCPWTWPVSVLSTSPKFGRSCDLERSIASWHSASHSAA